MNGRPIMLCGSGLTVAEVADLCGFDPPCSEVAVFPVEGHADQDNLAGIVAVALSST